MTGQSGLQPSPPATPLQWVRLVGNAANLSTALGLLIAWQGRASIRRGPHGLLVAEGYRLRFPVAGAFTIGNVVITSGCFTGERPTLSAAVFAHEEQHTWQWLACLGLPFLPAYAIAMGWSWLRCGHHGSHNVFEHLAGLESGGYRRLPTRPLRAGVAALPLRWRARRAAPRTD